jgi:hypothetical protein
VFRSLEIVVQGPRPMNDPSSLRAAALRASLSRALPWLGALVWLALTLWKLADVPGMVMDEGWSIVSARGQWPAANPLSGLTIYSGPFPVLLLRLFGARHGLLVLRGTSVLMNGLMLVLIARMFARLYPVRVLRGWALPLIASLPVWVVALRTGIEVLMLMPALTVIGLYLLTLGTRWAALGAGIAWGLLVYNHLIGACFPVGMALAWLLVYRRWPPFPFWPFLSGLLLGVSPRALALGLYGMDLGSGGSASKYALESAVADLRWLPKALWETWTGETVYLRYCGRVALEIWPYWALGLGFLLPWLRRPWQMPKAALFCFAAALLSAVVSTIVSPYMGVRFFVLPLVGACAFLALLGAGAIERDARWGYPLRALGLALTACNLFYLTSNFYLPWARRELGITTFFLGARSPYTTSWGYLPKDGLVRALLELSPRPEQVITNATIDRPLRALLHRTGISSVTWDEADSTLSSVFVDYVNTGLQPTRCVNVPGAEMCFHDPQVVDQYFVLYR